MNARIAGLAMMLALGRAASAQDFTLTLQPNTLTLIPNEGASLVVSMSPLNGFTNQVTLFVGTLPSGVTAQFSPQKVTLPGTSILSLSAATNATLGAFTLNISASGGGITNTTSSSVTVNFGLLPICTGAFSGQVTDAQTGLPVPHANVSANNGSFYVQADTNGIYTLTNAPLGINNAANLCYLQASASGYSGSAEIPGYAVCDATNTVNLQLVPNQYGSISGTVSIRGGGPAVGVPVILAASAGDTNRLTDSNGNYQFTRITLGYTNAPVVDVVQCSPTGYWGSQSNAVVQANGNTVVNLIIVPICHGTVTGSVFYGDTRLPATNLLLEITDAQQNNLFARADTNGNYSITNVVLGENGMFGASVGTPVVPDGYYGSGATASITNCGGTASAPPIYLPAIPKAVYGSATGHVYDVQTGLPIAQAGVVCYGARAITDTNGAYLCTNVYVGVGTGTSNGTIVTAIATGYFTGSSNIVVYGGQTATQDVYLLRIGYGGVMGTVRDSATGMPLTNVILTIGPGGSFVYPRTDVNGLYFSGPLPLGFPNVPTYIQVLATPSGYYEVNTNTTITLGVTNVLNLDLLKVCTGATIIGNVVNAQTQQPITNATLYATGTPYFYTDTNGNFIMTNITVGNDNSPIQVTVYASAPGFISQSKTVTIFCNATVITDFGAPPTAFATIEGRVTNAVTGLPLPGAFIGSEFGESTLADSNGFYQLTQAPLGANNSSRTWTVTAIPTNFAAQTLSVTVSSNAVSTLDFSFGAPPAALIVTASGAPDPVAVGGQLLYLVTLTNAAANAQQVRLSDTLPSGVTFVSAAITNSPGTPFSAPVYSNNAVTTTAADFGSNSAVTLAITVTPTLAGTLTNVAAVSSSTPDIDSTGSNHTAAVITSVIAPAVPTALIVAVQATPAATVTVGSNLLYTVTLTNTVANASNVVLVDTLPPSAGFVSASVSNSPGGQFSQPAFSNGAVSISAASFGSNSAVVLFVTVTPAVAGTLTNVVNVTSTTTNLAAGTTLSASAITSVISPVPAAPTALIVAVQATPAATVTVGSNLLYTVTLTNTVANASNVVLVDALPPSAGFVSASVSNSPGGQFSQPVFSNGAVSISAASFGSNSAVVLFVTATPAVAGTLTNVVNVTSATTNLAAGTTLSATVTSTAVAPPASPLYADVGLSMNGAPNPVLVSNQLTYTLYVTNFGPAAAPAVVLTDSLPANVTFGSAVVSQGAYALISNGVQWNIGALSNQAFASATVVVLPLLTGAITNTATVFITPAVPPVTDTNPADNTTSLVTTVTALVLTNMSIQFNPTNFSAANFNPQTGLYQQTVQVNNLGNVTAAAVRVAVLDLPSGVTLYNATGSTNGVPFVEYDQPVAPGGNVVFLLEYYDSTRQPFVSSNFLATIVAAVIVPPPTGTYLQLDTASFASQGQLTIEFASVPGHTYVVQYSSDLLTWQTATPPIVAKNTRTQWIDTGPPGTESLPGSARQRIYRIVQTN